MTKLEIVTSPNFNNYVNNYALAQRKEIEELDFDIIYDRYMQYVDNQTEEKIGKIINLNNNQTEEKNGKIINLNDYQEKKKRKEITNYILKNTKSW